MGLTPIVETTSMFVPQTHLPKADLLIWLFSVWSMFGHDHRRLTVYFQVLWANEPRGHGNWLFHMMNNMLQPLLQKRLFSDAGNEVEGP